MVVPNLTLVAHPVRGNVSVEALSARTDSAPVHKIDFEDLVILKAVTVL